MNKTLYFIAGLPRSGSNLIAHILHQNTNFHIETASNLLPQLQNIHFHWNDIEHDTPNRKTLNKKRILRSFINEYYDTDKQIIIDRNLSWISNIDFLENILDQKIKIIVCVRNPAEIIASFEKFRVKNPLITLPVDLDVPVGTLQSRANYYSDSNGLLGYIHYTLTEKIDTGYLDRFLFVDYNRFTNNPVLHLEKIYNFLKLPFFDHDLETIQSITGHLNKDKQIFYNVDKKLKRSYMNPVEYIGLDLYEKYNTGIFWNQWI